MKEKKIKRKFEKTNIEILYPCFDTYQQQSKKYVLWEMSYLWSLKSSNSPDYPLLIIRLDECDFSRIENKLIKFIDKIFVLDEPTDSNYSLDLDDVKRDSIKGAINIEVPDDFQSLNMIEKDICKVRYDIYTINGDIFLTIYPIVNFLVDTENCEISEFVRCSKEEADGKNCPICFNYYFNLLFLKYIYNKIDITGSQFGSNIQRIELESQKRWKTFITS